MIIEIFYLLGSVIVVILDSKKLELINKKLKLQETHVYSQRILRLNLILRNNDADNIDVYILLNMFKTIESKEWNKPQTFLSKIINLIEYGKQDIKITSKSSRISFTFS